ncbi:lysophospholipid acyltransferase family protein [Roseovarius sp. D0-M9]|uniref:lysophospholipid acyltransferase family protein n=1 Tax=Roseovarius sp. D0-M9 TaxID=3127117 RepID=UPI003010316C
MAQMQRKLRSLAFDGLFALWTGSFALGIPFLWLVGRPAGAVRAFTRLWVRGVVFLLRFVVGLTYTERGRAHRQPEAGIIISNHESTWETLVYLVLFPDVAIVAKKELLRIPVLSWYLRHSPMIIIDRETGSAAFKMMLKQGRAALAEGRPLLLFPQGSRMLPGEPIRFRRGIELLYTQLGTPVLPVVVNSGDFWGAAHAFKQPGTITVSYLEPVPPGLPAASFTQTVQTLLETERPKLGTH